MRVAEAEFSEPTAETLQPLRKLSGPHPAIDLRDFKDRQPVLDGHPSSRVVPTRVATTLCHERQQQPRQPRPIPHALLLTMTIRDGVKAEDYQRVRSM